MGRETWTTSDHGLDVSLDRLEHAERQLMPAVAEAFEMGLEVGSELLGRGRPLPPSDRRPPAVCLETPFLRILLKSASFSIERMMT